MVYTTIIMYERLWICIMIVDQIVMCLEFGMIRGAIHEQTTDEKEHNFLLGYQDITVAL
jgi:hypothetical protein